MPLCRIISKEYYLTASSTWRSWQATCQYMCLSACFTLHIPLYDYERIKSMREKESIGAETLKGASRPSVEREGLIG